MDNQQNQTGPMPGDDVRVQNAGTSTGSTGLGNDATVSGAGAGRKGGTARGGAQATTSQDPTSQQDNSQSADGQRQGEGEQSSNQASALLDTALNSGKKWIEDSGVLNNVNQLPQALKDLGNRAVSRVNELSTTQKVVGGAILAVGLGWLATRKGKSSAGGSESPYNYGNPRGNNGNYGRRSYGYQSPDASTSRRPAVGTAGASRADSGAPYGSSGRYGSASSYGGTSSNTGVQAGSGRSGDASASSFGSASANTDHGARTSESSRSNDDGFRSIE